MMKEFDYMYLIYIVSVGYSNDIIVVDDSSIPDCCFINLNQSSGSMFLMLQSHTFTFRVLSFDTQIT